MSPETLEKQLIRRVHHKGAGWAFSQSDFAELGTRSAIDITLHRLAKEGKIRRVIRGIYDYPRYSELLQQAVSPDIDQIANALARKFGWRIQPDGATAQNLLGLSTQVPAKAVYLSDGPNRAYKIGPRTTLTFKHTALKEIGFKLRESSLVVQALKAFGEERISPAILTSIRSQLAPKIREKMLRDTRTSTGWVYSAIQQIAAAETRIPPRA